jgi:hypothetical protein
MLLAVTGIPARASCGSANCFLVTGTQDGVSAKGHMVIDLSYRYIPMDVFHSGASKTGQVVTPKVDFENGVLELDHHSEIRTINELLQLDASYGITDRLTVQIALPLINDRMHEHFDDFDTIPEFSRSDGTNGFGDIRLVVKYALIVSTKHLLVVGVGLKIPSGEYKLLDSHGDLNEPTLMPGTGSWDPLFSAHYSYELLPHRLNAFLSGSYQLTTENDLAYEFADTVILSTGLTYLLLLFDDGRSVSTSLQINSRFSAFPTHDQFRGMNVPSTGGAWVYLTPGVRVDATKHLSVYSHFQYPLYQYVNEVNLVPRYGLILGASYGF